jgi:hypothetical protein
MAKKATEYGWEDYPSRQASGVHRSIRGDGRKAAINAAIEEFRIDDPVQQKRPLAQRDQRAMTRRKGKCTSRTNERNDQPSGITSEHEPAVVRRVNAVSAP